MLILVVLFHRQISAGDFPAGAATRGGGKLAPENTLAAIDVGARYGHTMIEFDAKLSKDGEIFLLHDDNLERTSAGAFEIVIMQQENFAVFRQLGVELNHRVAVACANINCRQGIFRRQFTAATGGCTCRKITCTYLTVKQDNEYEQLALSPHRRPPWRR